MLKTFVLMISRSSLKLVTWSLKVGHQAKSRENLVNTLRGHTIEVIFMNLAQNVCLDDF